jgi:hypothetical protein
VNFKQKIGMGARTSTPIASLQRRSSRCRVSFVVNSAVPARIGRAGYGVAGAGVAPAHASGLVLFDNHATLTKMHGGSSLVLGHAGELMSSLHQPDAEIRPVHTPEAILANPRFAEACKAYVREIIGLHENNTPFLNRQLIDAGRSFIFFAVICLNAAYKEDDRATWPTMQLMQHTMVSFGLSSPRRVNDIVARFIESGYIKANTALSDRRARLLAPTAKMLAHDRDVLVAYYRPLDVMFPDPGYGPPLRRDPAFQRAQRIAGIGMLAHSARFMMSNPAVTHFVPREAGMMVLTKLVELTRASGEAMPPVSFANLGDSFGVSRTHVCGMLQDAERAGLARISNSRVALTPDCLTAFDRFVADCMSGNDLIFRVAVQTLASDAARSS